VSPRRGAEASPRPGLAVFIQARLGSRRLPGKALLPLQGGNVIQLAMRALKRLPADVHALLTDRESFETLAPFAREESFEVFPGPEEDVLERFCLAIEAFRARRVVRATGDNPLVSPRLAELLLRLHEAEGADLSHFAGIPLGTGVEAVEAEALIQARAASRDPYEHEHITTYLYRHPERFRVRHLPSPPECALPEARVTLDTEEDYRLIARLFQELYHGHPIETEEIVAWFRLQHQEGA